MLSRVAENLFWMSRYLERAENVARLLDIGLYLELDAPSSTSGERRLGTGRDRARHSLEQQRTTPGQTPGRPEPERGPRVSLHSTGSNPNSLVSTIRAPAKTPAAPRKAWESTPGARSIASTSTYADSEPSGGFTHSASALYATVKQSCILFDGMVQNTLPRDEVYHFIRLGRHLERVCVMGQILHAKCRSATGRGRDHRPGDRAGALDRVAPKLLGLRRLSSGRARPRRSSRRDSVSRPQRRLSAGDPLLRRPLPRIAA